MTIKSDKGRYTSPDGSRKWEYIAAFVCSIQSLTIGCFIGWMSPVVVKLLAKDSPIPVDHDDISTIAALGAFGHLIGPIISRPFIDQLGRKSALFWGSMPIVICWILKYFATNIWMLMVARFLGGLAFGTALCVGPLYVGEIASVELRGMMGAAMSVMFNFGLLIAYIITPYLNIPAGAAIQLLIAIIVQIALYFIPESPYFLVIVNRDMEAEAVLEKLRGKIDVTEELDAIKNSISSGSSEKKNSGMISSLKRLFGVRQNYRAFIITTLFVIPQAFGGFVSIIVYGHVIFESAGNTISKNVGGILIACAKIVASAVASLLIDRLGRKPLIFVAGVAAGMCNFIIGGYFIMKEYMGIDVTSYSIIPIVAAMGLVFAFNIGLIGLQSVLISEVFSTDIKAIGTCLTGVIGGIAGVISIKMYLIVVEVWHIGHSVPFFGFGCSVLATTMVLIFITPETKGKTLAQIQELLSK